LAVLPTHLLDLKSALVTVLKENQKSIGNNPFSQSYTEATENNLREKRVIFLETDEKDLDALH
jgi:hypothetical protein